MVITLMKYYFVSSKTPREEDVNSCIGETTEQVQREIFIQTPTLSERHTGFVSLKTNLSF